MAVKPVPVGLVIEVLLEKLKVPPLPVVISMPASPPFSVLVPLKLYVPSALLNCRPVPLAALSVPVWKVIVPLLCPEMLTIACDAVACVIPPL